MTLGALKRGASNGGNKANKRGKVAEAESSKGIVKVPKPGVIVVEEDGTLDVDVVWEPFVPENMQKWVPQEVLGLVVGSIVSVVQQVKYMWCLRRREVIRTNII